MRRDEAAPKCWTETEDGSSTTFVFDGIDAAKRDADELTAFAEGLKTPARPDLGGLEGQTLLDNPLSPERSAVAGWMRMLVVLLSVVIAVLVSTLAERLAEAFARQLSGGASVALGALGVLAFWIFVAFRFSNRRSRSRRPLPSARFAVRFDAGEMVVAVGPSVLQRIDIKSIAGFDSGRRIVVRKHDGTREEIVCVLANPTEQSALAARLEVALLAARTATTGYRGANLRVSESAEELPVTNDHEPSASDADRAR